MAMVQTAEATQRALQQLAECDDAVARLSQVCACMLTRFLVQQYKYSRIYEYKSTNTDAFGGAQADTWDADVC